MSNDAKVPKGMEADAVIWAMRYGVTTAMRSRRIYPKHGMSAYVQAPSNVLKLADRVCRVWLTRHPRVDGSSEA
jgi:hypothetical protein